MRRRLRSRIFTRGCGREYRGPALWWTPAAARRWRVCCHVLRARGVRAVLFHGRSRAATVCAAFTGGGVFDDRLVCALKQSGACVLGVADEARGWARRARGFVRTAAPR